MNAIYQAVKEEYLKVM